jgi:hypothetical protein
MTKSVTAKSVTLPLELSRGTRIFVQVDPKFPYTVLYDRKAPVRKRVIAVIDKEEPLITIPGRVDVRFLLLVGSVDAQAWEATRQALDQGIGARLWPTGKRFFYSLVRRHRAY